MKKKNLLALGLVSALSLSLTACGGDAPAEDEGGEAADDASYVVGICQMLPHAALDAATQGFKDKLEEALPGQVTFEGGVGAGDSATCTPIVNQLVSSDVDLIMANATAALQVSAAATSDIPILGTSVTEYGVALGLTDFNGTVGTNVSGTSDLAPLDQQAAMIKEWCPDAETVGLLYCSGEPNSQYQVDTVAGFLEEAGVTCTMYPFADSNDIAAVTQTAVSNSDVLYIPTDNTAASNMGLIDNICRGVVPVFTGEEGMCKGGGVATLSIDYYDLGAATGEMAVKILTGEADVAEMPVAYTPMEQVAKKYNPATCEALGLTAPEGYVAIEAE